MVLVDAVLALGTPGAQTIHQQIQDMVVTWQKTLKSQTFDNCAKAVINQATLDTIKKFHGILAAKKSLSSQEQPLVQDAMSAVMDFMCDSWDNYPVGKEDVVNFLDVASASDDDKSFSKVLWSRNSISSNSPASTPFPPLPLPIPLATHATS